MARNFKFNKSPILVFHFILCAILFCTCELPELNKKREDYFGRLKTNFVYSSNDIGQFIFWNTGILNGPGLLPNNKDSLLFLNKHYDWGYFCGNSDTILIEKYNDTRIEKAKIILTSDTTFIYYWNTINYKEFTIDRSRTKPDSSKFSFYMELIK